MIGYIPHHLHKFKYTELNELYLAETFKNLAHSLVGIFVPVYLLSVGYSFTSICLLFIILNSTRLIIEPFVGYLVGRFGPKHILAFSYPFSFTYLLMIGLIDDHNYPLFIVAAIWAVAESLHWISYHCDFSKIKKSKKTGSEMGIITVLGVVTSALGPLVGGYVAKNYGLHWLFYIAPALLVLAAIPLFKSKERVQKTNLSYSGLFTKYKYDLMAHTSLSFDVSAATTLWPLFIYLIVKDYLQMGVYVSMAFLLSVLSIAIIGFLTDKINKKFLVLAGSLSLIWVNILRATTNSIQSVFRTNMIGTVLSPLGVIPLFSLFYQHAEDKRRIEYHVLIEMSGDIGRAILWGAVLFFSATNSINQSLVYAFYVTAGAVFLMNIVKSKLPRLS